MKNGLLVSGSYDNTFKVWDPKRDFALVKEVQGTAEDDWMTVIVQLNNGMLASASSGKIDIWNPEDNYKLIKTLTGHGGIVQALRVLSNGMLASSSDDETIKIWNPTQNYALVKTLTAHTASITSLAEVSGGILVSASYDKTIKFWDIKNNFALVNSINQMAYSLLHKDGLVVFGSTNNTVKIVDPTQNFSLTHTLEGHSKGVIEIVDLGDGYFASGARDGLVIIWFKNNNNYETMQTIDTQEQQGVVALYRMKNGNLVSGHYDTIKIWTNVSATGKK